MEIEHKIIGSTRIMGIIGNPVEHSISPQLHNTISKHLGIDAVYVPFKVEKQDLENATKGMRALNAVGFNVTVPYKKDVMKYIDENSKEALLMGAVNTVKCFEGRLFGYNTDADGFARSFKEETGVGFSGKTIAVIGAGGAARAIVVKLAMEGAKKIYIINRTVSKAVELAEIVNNNMGKIAFYCGDRESGSEFVDFEAYTDSDIIINTTSIGMHPNVDESPVPENIRLKSSQIVYDVIYNPDKTKLLKQAEENGCKCVNGLGMLFYQGITAYEIWTGVRLKEDFLTELYKNFQGILTK